MQKSGPGPLHCLLPWNQSSYMSKLPATYINTELEPELFLGHAKARNSFDMSVNERKEMISFIVMPEWKKHFYDEA